LKGFQIQFENGLKKHLERFKIKRKWISFLPSPSCFHFSPAPDAGPLAPPRLWAEMAVAQYGQAALAACSHRLGPACQGPSPTSRRARVGRRACTAPDAEPFSASPDRSPGLPTRPHSFYSEPPPLFALSATYTLAEPHQSR
jgi:hypothetical protein